MSSYERTLSESATCDEPSSENPFFSSIPVAVSNRSSVEGLHSSTPEKHGLPPMPRYVRHHHSEVHLPSSIHDTLATKKAIARRRMLFVKSHSVKDRLSCPNS